MYICIYFKRDKMANLDFYKTARVVVTTQHEKHDQTTLKDLNEAGTVRVSFAVNQQLELIYKRCKHQTFDLLIACRTDPSSSLSPVIPRELGQLPKGRLHSSLLRTLH